MVAAVAVIVGGGGIAINTWGISGPTFLGIYVGLLAVVAGVLLLRYYQLVRLPVDAAPLESRELGCCELALLKDGPRFAVAVAACDLHAHGSVEPDGSGGTLVVTDRLPWGAHPLEAAVYEAVRRERGRPAKDVLDAVAGGPEVARMRERLEALGLAPRAANVVRFKRERLLLVGAVVVLGVARIVAGVQHNRPIGFLFMLVGLTVVAGLITGRELRTGRGDHALAQARETQAASEPIEAGAAAAAAPGAAIALGGYATLWSTNPALAVAMDSPRTSGGWLGGDVGGGGGDGGGCGGGCGG